MKIVRYKITFQNIFNDADQKQLNFAAVRTVSFSPQALAMPFFENEPKVVMKIYLGKTY